MYILVNIIIYLNMQNIPLVNVITNFQNLNTCESKFEENLSRIKGSNKTRSVKIDQDKKYLEISDLSNNLKSYWFCN